MRAYSKEVRLSWLCSSTIWKVDGTCKLVFDFLDFPFSVNKYYFDVDDDGMGMQHSIAQ